jgi:hypothetical protein
MKTLIKVQTQFEALHRYFDAPENVSYLGDYHRHLFKVTAIIEVFSDERELEFFTIKEMIDLFIKKTIPDKSELSCESMSRLIVHHLRDEIAGNREIMVEVNEDGEDGAIVCY